jgi:hypothetical protein
MSLKCLYNDDFTSIGKEIIIQISSRYHLRFFIFYWKKERK